MRLRKQIHFRAFDDVARRIWAAISKMFAYGANIGRDKHIEYIEGVYMTACDIKKSDGNRLKWMHVGRFPFVARERSDYYLYGLLQCVQENKDIRRVLFFFVDLFCLSSKDLHKFDWTCLEKKSSFFRPNSKVACKNDENMCYGQCRCFHRNILDLDITNTADVQGKFGDVFGCSMSSLCSNGLLFPIDFVFLEKKIRFFF